MAFNPFHTFRKYKKTAFAVLTIICMFVFILSSGLGGKGDLLSGGTLFGGGSNTPEVARLDGKKIDAHELQEVRRERQIANEYMRQLVLRACSQLSAGMEARVKDMDPLAKSMLSRMLADKQGNPRQYYGQMQQNLQLLDFLAERLKQEKKTDDADLLRQFRRSMELEMRLLTGEMYFRGGTRSGEELLDFMVWRWVADQRDIHLSPEMVEQLVKEETFNQDIREPAQAMERDLRKRYGITIDGIRSALMDEYRVRIAQTAVLGVAPWLTDSIPSYVTPYEFYKFFRDNRTTVRVNLLPIGVDAYLDKVTEKPTEAELRDLFAKHQREEPAPYLERPGFKESKKVKLEWLSTRADNAVVKKAALEQAQKVAAFARSIKDALLWWPPPPNLASALGFSGLVAITEDPKLIDRRIDKEYEAYVANEKNSQFWTYPGLIYFGVHDRSYYQPPVIAAGLADILATGATGAGAFSLPATWYGRAGMEEIKERIRFGLIPFALAGLDPKAMFGVTDLMLPRPLSREAMANVLQPKVTDETLKDYLRTETTRFQEELTKKAKDIKKPEVKQEVQKLIDEFAKRMGFSKGASAEFHDRFSLIADPGLKALRDAYLKDDRNKADPKGHLFGTAFFDDPTNPYSGGTPYHALWLDGNDPSYASFAKPDDQYFLAWKTEEEAPKVRKFEEARADVEKAWRLNKARELARKDAEEMQKQLRDKGIRNLASLKDFAAEKKIEPIEVGPLAKMNEHPGFTPTQPTQYMRPQVPGDKVLYATEDFADKLVELRDKPIGETIVLNNMPRSIYYVGVLTERSEPSELSFQMLYSRSTGEGMLGAGGDPMLRMFEAERTSKLVRETMERLRSDARLEKVEERLKDFTSRESGGGGVPVEE